MLKVGVVGVGSMGQNHARIYSEMGCLTGVFDIFNDAAVKIAKRFNVPAYGSVDELIDNVDALSVCTITSEHYDIGVKAIEAGKHVLIEKPFTGDVAKAEELCELAEERGTVLASGFVERCNPAVTAAKESLAAGRFGDLVTISSRRVSSFPSRIRDVGVIMDLAVHDVDVMRHITEREIVSVYALGGKKGNPQFEDFANLLMELDDGSIGNVEVNWLTPMKVRKLSLTCSKGYVQLDYIDQSLEYSTSRYAELDLSNMSQVPMELDVHHIMLKKDEPLKVELERFLSAAEGRSGPGATGRDAVANLKVCDAALRSLVEGRREDIC